MSCTTRGPYRRSERCRASSMLARACGGGSWFQAISLWSHLQTLTHVTFLPLPPPKTCPMNSTRPQAHQHPHTPSVTYPIFKFYLSDRIFSTPYRYFIFFTWYLLPSRSDGPFVSTPRSLCYCILLQPTYNSFHIFC